MTGVVLRRVMVTLAASLVVAGCTSGGSAAKGTTGTPTAKPTTTTTTPPTVLTSVTPPGWVPVEYGDAQVSVPADWKVLYDASCPLGGPPGTLFVGRAPKAICPSVPISLAERAPSVSLQVLTNVWDHSDLRPTHVNGLPVEQVGTNPIFLVPSLGVVVSGSGGSGRAVATEVVDTLTTSPGPSLSPPVLRRWCRSRGSGSGVATSASPSHPAGGSSSEIWRVPSAASG